MTRISQATPAQIIAVGKLLDRNVTSDGMAVGLCRYLNGEDDDSIAREVGLHSHQVKRLRQSLKGKLQVAPRPGAGARHQELLELAAVVSKTALAVAELAAKLGEHDLSKILRGLAQDATLAE